ncbi:MAG: FG-GAP-like repeat-containing protein [Bacteroidia bacterium]
MKTFTYYCLLFIAICVLFTLNVKAQFSFTNSNSQLTTASHSGCSVTVVDVNNDGLDDILKMEQSRTLVLELQNRDGSFTRTSLGLIPDNDNVWGMAAADVDHNGWKDVAAGSGSCYLYKLFYSGGNVTATITQLPLNYFVQNITFGDFNNDGWADLTVCDDNDYSKVYVNNAGTLAVTTTLINTNINPGMFYGSDPYDSGNYGSVWTDFDNDGDLDLYIAHCRQSTSSPTDQRRRDRLFVNNGSNVYTEQAQAYGIEVTNFKQTWTTSFGDINNDGDLDIIMTNHGENGQILQNDGTGHFTDITATTGFTTPSTDPIESFVEDFDNDGFIDILISGGGPGNSYFMYHNNGNNTFTLATTPIPATSNGMLSFAAGDLNHDGKVDIFASYGNVYNTPTSTDDVLLLNTTGNTNHFITFALTGTASNHGAIGARATIYGAWGKQIREVRAGESYGTCNSSQLHFGLAQNTVVDSAVINWPSGQTTTFTALGADQFVTVVEGGCSISTNIIGGGPYILCSGSSLTLTAPPGFSTYDWSTGATTQSITVTTAGNYNVLVTSANGCSNISPSVVVVLNPDETPTVSASGDLVFCQGGSVTLTSTPASSYLWSNGATTQSISVTQSGTYSLTIQGVCGAFSSVPVTVNAITVSSPATTGDTVCVFGSAILTGTGTGTINWYDALTGGNLLGTGNIFSTPILFSTTNYYADNTETTVGATGFDTPHDNTFGGGANHTDNTRYLIFNAVADFELVSVKVYAQSAGNRTIQLRDDNNAVLQSIIVNLPVGESRAYLNFNVTTGNDYRLGINGALVDLYRNNAGVSYPYSLSGLVDITGSSAGSAYYYFYYDWEVKEPDFSCSSARNTVEAFVDNCVGINENILNEVISVYPNPNNGQFIISFTTTIATDVKVEVINVEGKIVYSDSKTAVAGEYKNNIELKNAAQGIYLMKIKTGEEEVQRKITVQ